jgi:hypothetical protein
MVQRQRSHSQEASIISFAKLRGDYDFGRQICQCLSSRRSQRRLARSVSLRGSRLLVRRGSAFFVRRLDTFMKTRRSVATFVLLATLLAGGISATADEKNSQTQTSLGNTTIGGYVSSSTGCESQLPVSSGHSGWWWNLCSGLGLIDDSQSPNKIAVESC